MYSYPLPIIVKYCDKIYRTKDYKHLLNELIDEQILKMYPTIRATMIDYILCEKKDVKLFYKYQEVLGISNKQLYVYSIDFLVSDTLIFDIQDVDYCKYYRLLQEFLTKGDYESSMRTCASTVKNMKSADEYHVLSIMECVAYQKKILEEMKPQMKKPTIFLIDIKKVTPEKLTILSTLEL